MTSNAKKYWAYARECESWAAAVKDEGDRAIFVEMQRAWAELALQKSAFRTRREIEGAVGSNGDGQMERLPASKRRKWMVGLGVAAVYLVGMTTGALLVTSGSGQIANTAFTEAKTALTFLSNEPTNAAR